MPAWCPPLIYRSRQCTFKVRVCQSPSFRAQLYLLRILPDWDGRMEDILPGSLPVPEETCARIGMSPCFLRAKLQLDCPLFVGAVALSCSAKCETSSRDHLQSAERCYVGELPLQLRGCPELACSACWTSCQRVLCYALIYAACG